MEEEGEDKVRSGETEREFWTQTTHILSRYKHSLFSSSVNESKQLSLFILGSGMFLFNILPPTHQHTHTQAALSD